MSTMILCGNLPMLRTNDQQVPDLNLDVVASFPVAGGVLSKKPTPHFPDFSTLLDPLNSINTPDLVKTEEFCFPLDSTLTGVGVMSEKPLSVLPVYYDDLSFYDGTVSADCKLIKQETIREITDEEVTRDIHDMQQAISQPAPFQNVIAPTTMPQRPSTLELSPSTGSSSQSPSLSPASMSEYSPASDASIESMLQDEGIQEEVEIQKLKIDSICKKLWMSKDPYSWNPEQVQKWAVWVLNEYYNITLPYLEGFFMDGTSLCMLSKDDFVSASPEYGFYLFAELEWWKSAVHFSEKQQSADELTYIELSPAPAQSLSSPDSLSSPPASYTLSNNSFSPTPMTSAETYCSQLTASTPISSIADIPRPDLSCLNDTSSTLNQINHEVQEQQHQMMAARQQSQFMVQNTPSPVSVSPVPDWENITGTSSDSEQHEADGGSVVVADSTMQDVDHRSEQQIRDDNAATRRYVSHSKHTIHLWQFLKDLLLSPEHYGSYIKWLDRSKGIFKIEDSTQVAKLWGRRKNRPAMNYDKLSRSIRQYYKKGIIKKTSQSKRLVYQFQPNYL